jgi:cell division protein FtsW (lipid II flippase)
MTVGRMVAIAIGGLILALIAGLVTRDIIVAILFPILLIGFLLIWRRINEETPSKPKEEEEKVIAVKEELKEDQPQSQPQPTPQFQNQNPQVNSYQQPMQNPSQPPVSTNYPPRQSLR